SAAADTTEEKQQELIIEFDQKVPAQICAAIHEQGLQSLIVEGGSRTLQEFIDAGLWDEARVFQGKAEFGKGVRAPELSGRLLLESRLLGDTLKIYRND